MKLGWSIKPNRAAIRFGSFLSTSRKRRRHRIRQWRKEQNQNLDAMQIDSFKVEKDELTGLNVQTTTWHDTRAGIKNSCVQIVS